MQKKNNKKVILISGGGSNWYEQAIFIIKDKGPRLPVDMVKEAENIIKRYIADNKLKEAYKPFKPNNGFENKVGSLNKPQNNKIKQVKKATKQTNFILNMAIVLCMALICCLIYLVFKL